jgi:hypothetical protein
VALLDGPGLTAHVVCLAQEIDTLCAEWQPEPLVPALTPAQRAAKPPVLVGYEPRMRRLLERRAHVVTPTDPPAHT